MRQTFILIIANSLTIILNLLLGVRASFLVSMPTGSYVNFMWIYKKNLGQKAKNTLI